jgi:hypothetical protein
MSIDPARKTSRHSQGAHWPVPLIQCVMVAFTARSVERFESAREQLPRCFHHFVRRQPVMLVEMLRHIG